MWREFSLLTDMQVFFTEELWTCFIFRIIKTHYPHWFPFVGGDEFEFFSPVFNIADASISIGVIALFLFQKRFVKKLPENTGIQTDNNSEHLTLLSAEASTKTD